MFIYIFIFVFIFLILYMLNVSFENTYSKKEKFTVSLNNLTDLNYGIPKIIHQTAPADKSKWNPEWYRCQETWKKYFPEPEYKHILWNDDDLANFIKSEYPEYYDIYISYDKNIKRIDMARYFILYKYGGIYADMDYMCFKNFYDLVPNNKISIIKSPYSWEILQNALMISPIGQKFWLKVIEESKKRLNLVVLQSTGPVLISDVYLKNKSDVNVLPVNLWNPLRDVESEELITKHLGTYSWSNEA